jgi:tRNA threonylcarbamoyladenosine biosynthesis protein TsaE
MAERTLAGERATVALGQELAAHARAPLVVGLSGPLGAGKTTLVRAWLRALGYQGAVRSPTYTLIETYDLPGLAIHHLDLYRLADPEELDFIGVRDLFTPMALCLIEWPERGLGVLPPLDWDLRLEHVDAGRKVSGLPWAAPESGVDTT